MTGTTPAAVVRASLRVVPAAGVALHLVAAMALLAAAWTGLDDDGTAVMVLRLVAVLLAAALALAVDEPGAAVLDATPTALAQRVGARLALCGVLVLPAWATAVTTASLRGAHVPVASMTLELVALVAVGLALPLALRRWWGVDEPALVVGPVLVGVLLGAAHLPRALLLLPSTPLDPAWDAAHLRWSAVLLAALAVLAAGLADPATAASARRRR